MSVWLCIPSKRPPEEAEKCLKLWRERGYRLAVQRDPGEMYPFGCDALVAVREYRGYADACNFLAGYILRRHHECDWVVLGGDDVEPDASHSAEEIAHQCSEYFLGRIPGHVKELNIPIFKTPLPTEWREALDVLIDAPAVKLSREQVATFGVMQPTGDRWGDKQGAYADRVCGSPWIGREFALRINQGRGPLWPEYFHMYEDEELFEVASKCGVLWQRPDLIHLHRHWARERGKSEDMPEFLKRANSQEEWRKAKTLFDQRKAAGFPGSEPL